MDLSEFSYDFKHIPGKSNFLADYLSRVDNIQYQDLNTNPGLISSKQALPVINCEVNSLQVQVSTPKDNHIPTCNAEVTPTNRSPSQNNQSSLQCNCGHCQYCIMSHQTPRDALLEVLFSKQLAIYVRYVMM